MPPQEIDPLRIGEAFQERTKYDRYRSNPTAGWRGPVPLHKEYPVSLPRVQLPSPAVRGGAEFWNTIQARRSVRRYGSRPLALAELSQLLWAAQGVTGEREGYRFRAAPSAGALYPVETYLCVNNVQSVEQGIYHYEVAEHALAQIESGDRGGDVAAAALDQRLCADAPVTFIWTAVVGRSGQKYAQRAYRYIYLDAGHIAQNIALAAVALGLGSCQIAALFDDELNALLHVDGREETAIYMTTVGPLPE